MKLLAKSRYKPLSGLKTPKLGYFGKVPSHNEFVSHNFSGGVGRDMSKCFELLWQSCDAHDHVKFVLHRHRGRATMSGVCSVSHDKVGRRAPFIRFAILPQYRRGQVVPFLLSSWLCQAHRQIPVDNAQAAGELARREVIVRRQLREMLTWKLPNGLSGDVLAMSPSERDYAFACLWQASQRILSPADIGFSLELPAPNVLAQTFWHYYWQSLLEHTDRTIIFLWNDYCSTIIVQPVGRSPNLARWRLTTPGEEARLRVGQGLVASWQQIVERRETTLQSTTDELVDNLK